MGAGIAAVAGIENEPSAHRADIEEAQAELRQELSGRNERRRELEFLEKGGDPLEFKFGEPFPGLWSLTPADPLAQSEYIQEDGSDTKRARGLSGKFCYQDLSATSISNEKSLSDALPVPVSSSAEHDRKDPPKKELDACKTNKVAVKGQYARRNRQRSNRFSNGLPASRDSGKVGTEGGPLSSSIAASDAEAKDVTKETTAQHVITDEVALQTRSTDAEVSVGEEQERVSAGQVPAAATTRQVSCTSEHAIESHTPESLALEARATEPNRGPKTLEQPLSIEIEDTGEISSSLLTSRGGEGQDLVLPGPRDAHMKKTTVMEPSLDSLPSVTKENMVDGVESGLSTEIATDPKVGQSEVPVSSPDEGDLMAHKPAVRDEQASSAEHLNTVDVIRTSPASESVKANAGVESVSPKLQSLPNSSNLEKLIQAKDEILLAKELDKSLEKEVTSSGSLGRAQPPGDIKVKVEDEAPSHSLSLPKSVSNSQEVATLQLQHRADDSSTAGAVADEKLPVSSMLEGRTDPSLGDGLKNTSEKADKTLEAEGTKDSVRDSGERANGKSFEETPRRRSHWDFVLEEMAWLANDFMQERLWKIAAAAQIARWIVKEKQQLEFEEMEVRNRQQRLAQGLAKAVKWFWQSVEVLLSKEAAGPRSNEALKVVSETETISSSARVRPVHSYAMRFLKDSSDRQWVPQAEAPPTPDRVSEFGNFDFWEEQFSEESLFYSIPQNAMEVYRQSVVSQWEGEYEQRLQDHEATMADLELHVPDAAGPIVSPFVTGKRSSGFLGGTKTNKAKRPRTTTWGARHRAAGGTGPLVSIPVAHLVRSDISSCETTSQQDEVTGFPEGSSVSGRATDVDSNGAFARNNLAIEGVDSPFRKKKNRKHFLGGHAGLEREADHFGQLKNHRQSEQKEQLKQKGDQSSLGQEGLGTNTGAYHGTASVTSSANKLIKQIASRDRNRKHKGGKASLSQPGVGIPWSPVEDQAILGLVHELGLNWELASDILSATSQLRGIFRKPKDCKERYRMLTERGGGDGGDSPDDPSSSAHHSLSVTYKGGTRYLPQHLEETLKTHVDCILQLHQQLRTRKIQSESQELKQLVPEHESHGIKHSAMTPLELCELSSASADLVPHSYPLQSAHGNGLGWPSVLPSGVPMRPTSSAALQGVNNLQMSPSLSPSAAINAAATRDAQRMGVSMRPTAAEEQRLRYNRMVAGRGLQTQGLSVASGSALVNLPNTTDGTAPPSMSSGNSAGMIGSLSRGMPVTRTGLTGVSPIGVPNISSGMSNTLPSVGMGLSGAGAVNAGGVSSPVNMMRRPREAISMGHSPSAALSNANSSLPNPVVSSPTQNFGVQQQLLQHNTLQSQQQSPSSSQQQAYNMMRVAKERQQLQQQQQQQKRMLQQQQSPTSNPLQSPFQSSQPLPASQQQHGLTHAHLFPQHQPSQLMMQQQHTLQEQQHVAPPSSIPQSAVSPSAQPSLSGSSQTSQPQQSLPTSTASPSQSPFQSKHQNLTIKQQQQQQQQQQQGKNMKGLSRGEGQANMVSGQVSGQISGQPMSQGQQRMGDPQGATLPQHLTGGASANLSDAGAQQQFSQKGFSQHLSGKHTSQQHLTPMSNSSSVQPASPPTGGAVPQQQPSPGPTGSLPSTQQRRAVPQSQGQQRRPQQSLAGMGLGTQLASQSAKAGLQASSVPSQLPAGYQLGVNTNSPLSMASPSTGVPLSSPSNTSSGGFASSQWKPGQTFTPMAAGLYNLSRSNSGIAAQAPHLAMSVGMHLPLPNGKIPVSGNSLATQEISRAGSQHVPGHVGTLPQKASVGPVVNSRPVGTSQHVAPSQRQLGQQQQLNCMPSSSTGGQQVRPASSGSAPAPE